MTAVHLAATLAVGEDAARAAHEYPTLRVQSLNCAWLLSRLRCRPPRPAATASTRVFDGNAQIAVIQRLRVERVDPTATATCRERLELRDRRETRVN
jgi:hypothetical protein